MRQLIVSTSILLLFSLAGCDSQIELTKAHENKTKEVATNFFATYAERQDWEKLLSFYSPAMQFEDVLLQLKIDEFEEFKKFYNWPDPNFKKLSPEQKHLEIESLVAAGNIAVAKGHFNPFMWQGKKIETLWGMEFTIWLYFDEEMKIVRQVDWIEYDDGVLESVIKRIREKGLDSKPPGL